MEALLSFCKILMEIKMRKATSIIVLLGLAACASVESLSLLDNYETYDVSGTPIQETYSCIENKIYGIPRLVKGSIDDANGTAQFSLSQGAEALWLVEITVDQIALKKAEGVLHDPYKRDLLEILESCSA